MSGRWWRKHARSKDLGTERNARPSGYSGIARFLMALLARTAGGAAGKIIVKVNRDWPAKFSTIDRSARACARCSIGIEPVVVGADFHELTVALFKRD